MGSSLPTQPVKQEASPKGDVPQTNKPKEPTPIFTDFASI